MRLAKLSLIDKVRWRKKPNDRPEKAGAAVSEFEFEFLSLSFYLQLNYTMLACARLKE